jgi:hypothetical protein
MLSGWHCPVCCHPFATNLGSDWQQIFQRSTSAELTSKGVPRCGADIEVEPVAEGLVVSRIGASNAHESDLMQWTYSWESAAIRRYAWEQCSAVADCLFGEHQACVAAEWAAAHIEFEVTTFKCPLGAAVAQTLAWLGCAHERCSGWPDSASKQSDALPVLWHAVRRAPTWLTPLLAREAATEWLSDAISSFSSVDIGAPARLLWRPPERLGTTWKCSDRSALIKVGPVGRRLFINTAKGARACRARGNALTG